MASNNNSNSAKTSTIPNADDNSDSLTEEELVDRLINIATQDDEEDSNGEYHSVSEGDSDEEKTLVNELRTLSEQVTVEKNDLNYTEHESHLQNTGDAKSPKDITTECNTSTEHESNERQADSKDTEARLACDNQGDSVLGALGDASSSVDVEHYPGDASGGVDSEFSEKVKDSSTVELEREKQKEIIRLEVENALTEEERQAMLAEAVKIKTEGNDAFKGGCFKDALVLYTKALESCPLKYNKQRSIMLSNRAACHGKEEKYEDVVKDCTKAIDCDPTYIKAINRRAEAYEQLDKLDEALKDHKMILELDRTQSASFHACMKLEKQIEERNEKLKAEMLGKLKELGNMVLRPFGLSTNNFQINQDSATGSYSCQFVQSSPNNGK